MYDKGFRLRPHHGMCLAYFAGHGYSDGFSRHTAGLLDVLMAETPVTMTVGTDCVCSACPNNVRGVCAQAEKVAGYDRAVLEKCRLREEDVLPFGMFVRRVQVRVLAPGFRPSICGGCRWESLCAGQSRWETFL